MATGYTFLEDGFLDDPDYETSAEKLVALHVMTGIDAAGVAPWSIAAAAERTAFCDKTVRRAIDSLDGRKLIVSPDRKWVWLKSGIFYRLNKGRYSSSQLKAVVDKLQYWGARNLFAGDCLALFKTELGSSRDSPRAMYGTTSEYFPTAVAQLYGVKYGITLPLASQPIFTVLYEELSKLEVFNNVDNLSTAGRRVLIRLSLSRYGEQLKEVGIDWIEELFTDYAVDRVLQAVDRLTRNGAPGLMGEPLPLVVRKICRAIR